MPIENEIDIGSMLRRVGAKEGENQTLPIGDRITVGIDPVREGLVRVPTPPGSAFSNTQAAIPTFYAWAGLQATTRSIQILEAYGEQTSNILLGTSPPTGGGSALANRGWGDLAPVANTISGISTTNPAVGIGGLFGNFLYSTTAGSAFRSSQVVLQPGQVIIAATTLPNVNFTFAWVFRELMSQRAPDATTTG